MRCNPRCAFEWTAILNTLTTAFALLLSVAAFMKTDDLRRQVERTATEADRGQMVPFDTIPPLRDQEIHKKRQILQPAESTPK